MSRLRAGERAVITGVLGADGSVSHRLHLLGFTQGREVCLIRRAPFRGPMIFRVCDVEMCLREAQAEMIAVTCLDPAAEPAA